MIPGTSLKGGIRSVVEAISVSCVCKVSKETRKELPRDFFECQRRRREKRSYVSPVACSEQWVFRGMWRYRMPHKLMGKSSRSLYLNFIPRSAIKLTRKTDRCVSSTCTVKMASGRTPIEACEVGSKFRFVVNFNNLTKAELGLFFHGTRTSF